MNTRGFVTKAGQRVQVNGFDWDAPHRAPRSISWTEQWHFGAGSHNRCGSRSSEHIQKRQRHPPPSRSVNLNSLPWATATPVDHAVHDAIRSVVKPSPHGETNINTPSGTARVLTIVLLAQDGARLMPDL